MAFGSCAGPEVPPPPDAPGQAVLDSAQRLRSAFERADRLAFMAEVDMDFRPSRNRLEQSLIDVALRARDVRLQMMPGERSHGPGETGLELRWYRTWVLQNTNQMERKEGSAALVFRIDGRTMRLLRIEGENPFEP
ncbi:MAG: hypothetical protein AAB576_02875 [Elusimicrobiota bacterium]